MTNTNHYNLILPDLYEKYVLDVFNTNMTTIDNALYNLSLNAGITEIPVASTDEVGGIKLFSSDGTNISGLKVYEDGTAVISTNPNYGTNLSGDGKVIIAAATTADIDSGANGYKPITAATAAYAFNKCVTTAAATTTDIDNGTDKNKLINANNIKYAVNKYATVGTNAVKTENIVDSAVTPEKTTFRNYTSNPVMVGTWIDGSAIRRQTFKIPYDPNCDLVSLLSNKSGAMCIGVDEYVDSLENVKGIVNAYCELYRETFPVGDVVPRYDSSTIDSDLIFDLNLMNQSVLSILKAAQEEGEGVYLQGYIEYIY